jgi:hypothetical protein
MVIFQANLQRSRKEKLKSLKPISSQAKPIKPSQYRLTCFHAAEHRAYELLIRKMFRGDVL